MKLYKILLFQPFIRSFVTNFGPYLKRCKLVMVHDQEETKQLYKRHTSFSDEVNRVKAASWRHRLRRLLGIPAVRIKFIREADLLFTYGAFVITNKPYCVLAETGLAPYSYDRGIASNPIARFIISFLLKRKNCKKIIFLGRASMKSFLNSAKYSTATQAIFKEKATYCYPLMESHAVLPRQTRDTLRLLFIGMFYAKGGKETVTAISRLRKKYGNRISLTIITSISIISQEDLAWIKKQDGLTLHNAAFSKSEMQEFYKSHDVFLLPTFRDSSPLVLLEALSWGLPIICNDQYATTEVAIDGYNALVYPNHPLKDYDPETYEIFGKYYNPKDFYTDLFHLQKTGQMQPIEDFIFNSIEKFLSNQNLLPQFSKNSLNLYAKNFHQDLIAARIEKIFLEAIEGK